ncbi:phytoene/squalene synthase family protein [Rhodococcus sp. NPDC058521]|uniref:phytoene/squalene synthase family protein n=1 Tax=Rhodococcus sp. NPDC058521 TaxID=3346536 RepID=UPI0036532E96
MPPHVAESYRHCARITAEHGRTYFLAARLLPRARRSAVHALYGFARVVDDLVDQNRQADVRVLDTIENRLCERSTPSASVPALDPVLPAFHDAVTRFDIPVEYFRAFLESMRMDVPGSPSYRSEYASMPQLREYMYGSAVVIGLQMLPVLGTKVPRNEAEPHATALGEAFQLTNFVRDVGEDLDRGRLYLPLDELAAFGVDRDVLIAARASGVTPPPVRRCLAHIIATTRATYRSAEPGVTMLDDRVQPGIRTAFTLYSRILDEIERNDFRVLDRRAVVPVRGRLTVALPQLVRLASRPILTPRRRGSRY